MAPTKTLSIHTSYDHIKDIPLVHFLGAEVQDLTAHSLWKDQPTIVVVIRRPGCQFCREEARILNAHRQKIEEDMGIRMACIVHEKEGSDIFQKDFWKGEVYFDPTKAFYKALGGGKLRTGHWEQMLRPSFWGNFVRNKRSGVKGNFEGHGHILGGLLVVKAGDQGIAYEHVERIWGDIAPVNKVLEACAMVSGVSVESKVVEGAHEEQEALRAKMAASKEEGTFCRMDEGSAAAS